jgi:hypothetical protein
MLMLVHSREPLPGDGEGPVEWRPNWRVWLWVAIAGVVGFAASNADGAVGMLLIFAAFYSACRALAEALPYSGGLTEWRQ